MTGYPRDMKGYGRAIPDPQWPGGAHVAVQFVLNYEEGGENNILHGDAASEAFLSEIVGAAAWPGQRHWNMESIYEYGARAGFWRLWRLFTGAKVPLTIYGVATAMMRSADQVEAMKEAGWEIASHGLKWVEHKDMPEDVERAQIAEAIRIHRQVTGERPLGWYTGRCSMNTTKLVMEEGGFLYSSDDYADDLPYFLNKADGGNGGNSSTSQQPGGHGADGEGGAIYCSNDILNLSNCTFIGNFGSGGLGGTGVSCPLPVR